MYYNNEDEMYNDIFTAPPRLIFTERPQVQALNCQPIFETSQARIVINAKSNKIENFTLLELPVTAKDAFKEKFVRHFSNETAYYQSQPITNVDAVMNFNTTVSWGYLFQLALLQACNIQGFITGTGDRFGDGVPGPTPFSFIQADLYSDPYSYAALALANYSRESLLDAETLTSVSQRVFSTFFQWFVSSKSGYTGDYWAYQKPNASLPEDLDFGSVESSVIITETITDTSTLCEMSTRTYSKLYTDEGSTMRTFTATIYGQPTKSLYSTWTRTESYITISDTRSRTSTRSSQSPSRTASATQVSTGTTSPAPTARMMKRSTATAASNTAGTDPNAIKATISVRTETLVISPLALFLSVGIIIFLVLSTLLIFATQTQHLRLLPRYFDSPASILAAVYASEKLQAWSHRQNEKRCVLEDNQKTVMWFGGWWPRKEKRVGWDEDDEDVAVRMGYFVDMDGEEHWGIEVVEDHPQLLPKQSSENSSRHEFEE